MMPTNLMDLLGKREESREAFLAALITKRSAVASGDNYNGFMVETIAPHIAARVAAELVSLAGRIKARCEEACNRELTEREEATLAKLEKKFQDIASEIGMEARTGGDPRGACAYLIDPNNRRDGDGWGEGWAVYA